MPDVSTDKRNLHESNGAKRTWEFIVGSVVSSVRWNVQSFVEARGENYEWRIMNFTPLVWQSINRGSSHAILEEIYLASTRRTSCHSILSKVQTFRKESFSNDHIHLFTVECFSSHFSTVTSPESPNYLTIKHLQKAEAMTIVEYFTVTDIDPSRPNSWGEFLIVERYIIWCGTLVDIAEFSLTVSAVVFFNAVSWVVVYDWQNRSQSNFFYFSRD